MTRMLGLRPEGAAGCCCCACAIWVWSTALMAVAAAIEVPPSRMLRRLSALSPEEFGVRVPGCLLLVPSAIPLSFLLKTDKLFRRRPPPHAAKPEMARRGIDRFRVPRRRAVAAAIVRRAQMRAALDHLARNPDIRLTGIVAAVFTAPSRIFRNAAGLRRIGFVLCRIPIGRPFPDIADHVVDA